MLPELPLQTATTEVEKSFSEDCKWIEKDDKVVVYERNITSLQQVYEQLPQHFIQLCLPIS